MAEQPPNTPTPTPESISAADTTPTTGHPSAHTAAEAAAGVVPSHGISINFPDDAAGHSARPPPPIKHMSDPTAPQNSPIRQHKRTPSKSKPVKETLNARSHYGSGDDDGAAVHRINQYIIKQEIGRGSFGAVHLAVDQYGSEYAVKDFSKSRLRKRAQSNLLRKPLNNNQQRRPGHLAAGLGFNSPLHRLSSSDKLQQQQHNNQQNHGESSHPGNNSLELIKQEIAIMKKLHHPNLVALLEVLDDPQEDSLYMVLEMCKKGVVMQVGLDERAEPYPTHLCRTWFRDMILGIEYLHAQGIIHRDIKPDNCLITADDVLKIVDFGVSEMFEKDQDMATAKSAGSPAFMPPELCVARHGQVSGKAADLWSMGVTLYCLRYGHIPFEREGLLELYESIRRDEVPLGEERDGEFRDMMRRLLEKDPEKRITMAALREHPWVTSSATDPLLPAAENCSDLVDPPTAGEVANAITGNMAYLMVVMKAVKRFKQILQRKRPGRGGSGGGGVQGLFGGREGRVVASPGGMMSVRARGSRSRDGGEGRGVVAEGMHGSVEVDGEGRKIPVRGTDQPAGGAEVGFGAYDERKKETDAAHEQQGEGTGTQESDPSNHRRHTTHNEDDDQRPPAEDHAKGHAHDPLTETLFLDVAPSNAPEEYQLDSQHPFENPNDDDAADGDEGEGEGEKGGKDWRGPLLHHVVSESPPEVEMNIYELAYQEEIKRILGRREDGDGNGEEGGPVEQGVGGGEVGEGVGAGARAGVGGGIHLTRRVEHRGDIRGLVGMSGGGGGKDTAAGMFSGFVGRAKQSGGGGSGGVGGGGGLAGLVQRAKEQAGEAKQESSEESEEAPLQAPQLDGADERRGKSADGDKVPDSILKAPGHPPADVQAHLDAASGAMPGMPGGFPVSPGGVATAAAAAEGGAA